MKQLASYLSGEWKPGTGTGRDLLNPATEEVLAQTSTAGLDLGDAMRFARDRGGAALRELTFAQRGELLARLAKALTDNREELLSLATDNGGNTRKDAKFDVDGASFTLAHYAELGKELGDCRVLADGDAVQVGRTKRLVGQHVWTARRGVAVHVNAFNFPAWGLAEKAAVALLAGMPVVTKPATDTAIVAHRMVELFVDSGALPSGALSLLCGSAGDLLEHLEAQDVLAFTGSGDTAEVLRRLESVVGHSVHVNVEADSLNAAVLGPDFDLGGETFQLFLADVVRDMTQKTGQKCTAIRRIMVPADRIDEVGEALKERLASIVVGNPADDRVRMGPLSSKQQLDDVRAGIERLNEVTSEVHGGSGEVEPVGAPAGKGFYVGPVLRRADDPGAVSELHDREIFGPVATLCAYDGKASSAGQLVALGRGCLVTSVYSDDRDFIGALVPELAPFNGRLYLGSEKVASQSAGPGTVLPMLLHGGPGRAGGGEELGGLRGMRLYQQRTALQGDATIIKSIVS
ncbi:MAG: 3,4-dehydroadipyl-CoA semialdehyde dehydrogenase [Deltaproteobacteria bacterium]|nr:3,4-dehydroadipyl-CoA semialdehyde dehydrogenase [Deltaproteobacteria bacterium]